MKDFFISYNRADLGWAEWIAWQLEAAGYAVVVQAWDFHQGGNFVLDMHRAVEESRRTIIVLSPDFLASKFTAPEWAAAFAQDPTGYNGRLLPIRVRDCKPDGLLAQIVYIDLVGLKNREEAQKRLLAQVADVRAKPQTEPGMPPLEPGQPRLKSGEEPPWPPSIELTARVAGHVFWHIARIAALAIAVAIAVYHFLSSAFPAWAESGSAALYSVAFMWGLITAFVIEAIIRLKRRLRGAPPVTGRRQL